MNLKEEFWERVAEVEPSDINSETVKVVSDQDLNWLLEKLIADIPDGTEIETDEVFINLKQQLRDKWL